MKRIIIVVSSWHVGGVTSVIRNQINQLTNLGAEVHLVALKKSDQCKIPDNCSYREINPADYREKIIEKLLYSIFRFCCKGLGNPFSSKYYAEKMDGIISEIGDPDAIFIHALRPSFLLRSFNHKRKVCVLHATKSHLLDGYAGMTRKIRQSLIANTYKNNHIVSVGDSIKEDFSSTYFIKKNKITTIPNGINISEIKEKSNQYKANIKNPFIVFIGRLEKVKGPEILLDAFINSHRDDLTLVFIGGGRMEEALKNKAKRSNKKIIFKGRIDNPFPYLKNTAMTVLPSRSEGMPMTALESLALGVSVLAADIAPFKEIRSPDIFFFEKENRNDLTNKINNIEIPYNGNPTLSEKFNAISSSKKYYDFF